MIHKVWSSIEEMPYCRLANHYAFCVITTHFECQIRHYASLSKMWENYAFYEISAPSRSINPPVTGRGVLGPRVFDPRVRQIFRASAIRPIPRNLQQLSWLAVSRKSPAGQNIDKDLFILRLPSHRRQISPSDQQRKLQRWSHAQWNVVLIVNRSNAGGSSPPMYRSENTAEDSVNVTIRHTVHKYMHIYDQCNFWATILPSTCVVIRVYFLYRAQP